jgi:5-oxoprolinase (ATP-hydrolysing)
MLCVRFEHSHTQLFSFSLELEVEIVNLRVIVEEIMKDPASSVLNAGNGVPPQEAVLSTTTIVSSFIADVKFIYT